MMRPFGSTGLTVSALGFGAGHIGDRSAQEVDALLGRALDLGVVLFDTAPSYGQSETHLGRALGPHRERLVLSTKGGYGVHGVADWTYDVIVHGVEKALRELRTDRIDVFHLHSCPRETLARGDVLRALEDVRDAGKIRVAAYSGENDALTYALEQPVFGSIQCSVNVCDQRSLRTLLPDAHARGLGVLGKRPLANAAFRFEQRPTGQYAETYWDRLQRMAIPMDADTALRFAAFAPGVDSVLVGTSHVAHLEAAAHAIARGPLAALQRDAILASFEIHGADWCGEI